MCAVTILTIRRLFSSFVLICFLWSTLFQSIAFADYTRAQADPVLFEEQGDITYAHFKVGAQKIEHPLEHSSRKGISSKSSSVSTLAPIFIVPIGKTQAETQALIDQALKSSQPQQRTTVVEDGLTWTTDHGLNLYRYNSGDLLVSSNSTLTDTSDTLHLYNYNGSTILEDNMSFEHLILSGKDVIQRGNRFIKSLSLCIDGTFVNEDYLSVSTLLFNDPLVAGSSTEPHTIRFANEKTFTAREDVTFGIANPIVNHGNMTFEKDVTFVDDRVNNDDEQSSFSCAGKLKGSLIALANRGKFYAEQGFENLRITEFLNEAGARIQGNGHLIVGRIGYDSVNEGFIDSSHLSLSLEGDFYNRHGMKIDEVLQTSGDKTFYQQGELEGKKAFIDNAHFENQVTLDSPSLDFVLGEHVTSFRNLHKDPNNKEITFRTKSFTTQRSHSRQQRLINSGSILTKRFDNHASAFTNEHNIEAKSWVQHGSTFTNANGSSLDVEETTDFNTTLLSNEGDIALKGETKGNIRRLTNSGGFTVANSSGLTIDRLENSNTFTAERGGFHAKTIRNTKTLTLDNGLYHIDRLENKTGAATIDQLSITSDSPILEGKLNVNHFKSAHEQYKQISIDGNVRLASGDFKTRELNIKGTLTLGKGHYHIDVLKGDANAKLLLERGARVTIGNVEYDGDIVASVSLELNPFKEANPSYTTQLREEHDTRKTAFNALPTATPITKPKLEETVYDTSKRIITAMSDYNRFDPNRSCDLTELKSRFKVRMGTEITRIIYDQNKRDTLDIQKTLPVLPTTDKLFGHFEITRYSSKISRDIVQRITTDGMDILDSLNFYVPSFESDFNVIKRYRYDLTRDMFMLWLKEVLIEHDEGFTPYKFLKPRELPPAPPAPTSQTGRYLTYCAPNSKAGGIDALRQNSIERQDTFNSLPQAKKDVLTIKNQQIYNNSNNVLGLLGRVSSKVATFAQKKDIIQTLMGSQITRVIHNEEQQKELDPEAHLPIVEETHWAYRHFEILRLTAKLTKQLVQQVCTYGYDVLNYVNACIPTFDTDHDVFCDYSGLQHEMFMLWFKEIFEKHKIGFPEPTASLTFLSNTRGNSALLTRLKSIKTTGSLILRTQGSTLSEKSVSHFLNSHRHILDIVKKDILIDAEYFANASPLNLPYSILFRVNTFQPKADLTVNGIRLSTNSFKLGFDNDHMIKVVSNGPVQAVVENDVDVQYGVFQSTMRSFIQSNSGNILIGARKNIDAATVVKNGAMITSNEELILKVLRKSILNNFGVAHGRTLLHYSAPKLQNTSSEGTSDDKIIVDVDDFDHLILDEIYCAGTGRSGADGGTYQQMFWREQGWGPWRETVPDWRTVASTSSINSQSAKASPSILSAKSDIIINSKKPPTIFASHFASNGSIWWRHNDGLLKEVPNGPSAVSALGAAQVATFKSLSLHDYFTSRGGPENSNAGVGNGCIIPTFASAQGININLSGLNILLEAAMSGKYITLTAHGLQIINGAGFRRPTRQTATLINVRHAADALYAHAPLTQRTSESGTIRYTRNVPGDHQTTYAQNIAVLPIGTQGNTYIPRSLPSGYGTNPFASHQSRPNVIFDDATLEHFCMHGQLNVTGRINERGAGLIAYMIENGHKLSAAIQRMINAGQQLDENHLMALKEPALFHWPTETVDGTMNILYALLSPDMNMPYHGTSGNIQGSDRVEIITDRDGIHGNGGTIGSGKGGTLLKTTNQGNFTGTSQTRRQYIGEGNKFGHADSVSSSFLIESEADIIAEIDGSIGFKGAIEFEAGKGTEDPHDIVLKSEGHFIGAADTLERHVTEEIKRKKSSSTISDTYTTTARQRYKASGKTLLHSRGEQHHDAPIFESKLGTTLKTEPGSSITLHEVHDTHVHEETHHKKGGKFSKSKTRQSVMQEATSVGAVVKKGPLLIQSGKDATVENITVDDLTIETLNGVARILLGTNYRVEQFSEKGRNFTHQRIEIGSERHDTFEESQIKNLTVRSLETIVQTVQGRIPEFMDRIKQEGGKLNLDYVREIHESTHFEHECLTPEFGVVLSLAAAIATYGACSWLGGYLAASMGMTTSAVTATGATVTTLTTAGSITSSMITGALSALTTQTIVTLANNKGNIGKTLKDLNKSETLKSVAIAASVAGLVGGGSLRNASFTQHLTHQAIKMSAQMGAETVFNGRTDGKTAALTAIAASFCGYISSNIGQAYTKGDFGYFTHKFLHALSGATGGAIIKGKEGAIAGAVGAAGVEIIADTLAPTGNSANNPNKPKYTDEYIQRVKDAARFTVVLIGLAAGLNAEQLATEITLATVAVENNFEQSAKGLKGNSGELVDEEDSEQNQSKSALTISGKKLKTYQTSIDNGYESDTSKHLRLDYERKKSKNDVSIAQGKKPTFFDNLSQFNAEQAYQDRLEFKQGIYANQRAIRYAKDHPTEVVAYAAGGTAIIASAAVTMPLTASLALGAGGAGLIEVGLKGGTIQSTQDLKDIGKAMVLGALPANKMRYLLPSTVVVGGLGCAFDDSTLMYGSAAIAGFSLALKGLTIASKSVGNVMKSYTQSSEIPLINASKAGQTALPIKTPAANSNITQINQFDRMSIPHILTEASEVNGWQHFTQPFVGESSSVGINLTTMRNATSKSIIPVKDSIISYGHVQDSTGKQIEAAVGIKGKESGVLNLIKPKTGLLEGANEASAAWKRVQTMLNKEQPWVIHHEGHIWKSKIIGEAQWTGTRAEQAMRTNAHAEQCYRTAIELAKDPNVEKVFLNRGIKKSSGHPIQGSNRRPDVTYVTKDGKVHQIEVESFTDKNKDLFGRMKLSRSELPPERQGEIRVINYDDYMSK